MREGVVCHAGTSRTCMAAAWRGTHRSRPPRPAGQGRSLSESAAKEQHDEDNPQHPGGARGPIAIRVIAPAGQTAKQEHKDNDQ